MRNLLSAIKWRYKDIRFAVKRKWQRLIRGYADSDLWNMDYTLAEYLYQMMDRFIKVKRHGYPCIPRDPLDDEIATEEDEIKSMQDWEDVLVKIREGFKAAKDISEDVGPENYPYPYEKGEIDYFTNPELEPEEHKEKVKIWLKKHNEWYEERTKVFEEGMDLFKKHFFSLWD